jgi:hypothetical protein
MADKLIAVLSCLPNTTYDFPALVLSLRSAAQALTIKSSPMQAVHQTQVSRMSCSANKTTRLLIYQPLPLAQVALLSMASQGMIIVASLGFTRV